VSSHISDSIVTIAGHHRVMDTGSDTAVVTTPARLLTRVATVVTAVAVVMHVAVVVSYDPVGQRLFPFAFGGVAFIDLSLLIGLAGVGIGLGLARVPHSGFVWLAGSVLTVAYWGLVGFRLVLMMGDVAGSPQFVALMIVHTLGITANFVLSAAVIQANQANMPGRLIVVAAVLMASGWLAAFVTFRLMRGF
jgi:hypothetical protein